MCIRDRTGTGTTSDVLSIAKSAALTVASPSVQVGTLKLTTAFATSIADLNGTANTADTYLYILNSSSGVETIELQTLATATCDAGSATVTQSPGINLKKGEFSFLPLKALAKIQFKGSAITAQLEYGYWSRSA